MSNDLIDLVKVSNPDLEIARGVVQRLSHVNKFGQNPAIASGTQEDIWDGAADYTYPGTADITHLRQAVDQEAMRGETVEVQGLDANWALTVQNVVLNNPTTTHQALATPLIRVFRMKVLANVVTDQNIELRNTGGGTTYALIQAGNNQTLMAQYTVPAGKVGYITNIWGSVATTPAANPTSTSFKMWHADRGNSYAFQLKFANAVTKENPIFGHNYHPAMTVTTQTDIKMTAHPVDKAASVYAGFDVILEDINA